MDSFTIRGENGSIKVSVSDTLGTDRDGQVLKGRVEIQQSNFRASGEILFSSKEVEEFSRALQRCYEQLKGEALFMPRGEGLEVRVGLHEVQGCYREHPSSPTELVFAFPTDQSYFQPTLTELQEFLALFGV
jgi:hypothetical protein